MNVQQSFLLSHEAQHLIFKRLRPSLALVLSSLAPYVVVALGNLEEHIVDENSALVLDHVALHFNRKNFHGFLMQERSGLKGCCWA